MSTASQLPASQATEIYLTVLNGPETGVAYRLLGQQVSLGRDADNDVVIHDNRSSRRHARLELRGSDYWIVDLGSQNGVLLNGQVTRQAALKSGDILRFGDTDYRFGSPSQMTVLGSSPPVPQPSPALDRPMNPMPSMDGTSIGRMPQRKTGSGLFLVIGVIAAAAYFIFGTSAGKRLGLILKSDDAVDSQIETITQANEKTEQEIARKGKDTQQYTEAQAFYMRGFREFREGNYGRAIQNFEAALALYPNHPLAKRYLDRSRLKLNELVTTALERGERDFGNQKYQKAYNEYRTVILLTNDGNNKSYQMAKKRMESIELILVNNK